MTTKPQSTTKPTLEPCPFCGGAASYDERSGMHYIRCESCARIGDIDVSVLTSSKTKSYELWNARVSAGVGPKVDQPERNGTLTQSALDDIEHFQAQRRKHPVPEDAWLYVAEIDRLLTHIRSTQTHKDLVALRQQVEDTILVAQTDEDSEGFITAYHFKTGAIHRLLAEVRK